ncbi:tetratricopeptide repeat protein, partial [Micromonospora sp. NPDC049107]|uniref:tetratricopeptide repeat protein n=1 Tax=Micromonospora sp. NPDC049107 TaxID=3154349 RepID=UPI0033F1366B
VYNQLGDGERALAYLGQALPIQREVGDRAGEAITLSNIGAAYERLGDAERALAYYGQALPIRREVDDRVGEAVIRFNVARIHRAAGHLDQAIRELELVVELDQQLGHPDLASDTAMLDLLREERRRAQDAT